MDKWVRFPTPPKHRLIVIINQESRDQWTIRQKTSAAKTFSKMLPSNLLIRFFIKRTKLSETFIHNDLAVIVWMDEEVTLVREQMNY